MKNNFLLQPFLRFCQRRIIIEIKENQEFLEYKNKMVGNPITVTCAIDVELLMPIDKCIDSTHKANSRLFYIKNEP